MGALHRLPDGEPLPEAGVIDLLEGDIEHLCDDLIRQLGGQVVPLSQRRASKIHRGLPDRRYRIMGIAFWFECKRPDYPLTVDEFAFLLAEAQHQEAGGVGGLDALRELYDCARWSRTLGPYQQRLDLVNLGVFQVGTWAERLKPTKRQPTRKAQPANFRKIAEQAMAARTVKKDDT